MNPSFESAHSDIYAARIVQNAGRGTLTNTDTLDIVAFFWYKRRQPLPFTWQGCRFFSAFSYYWKERKNLSWWIYRYIFRLRVRKGSADCAADHL